MGKKVKQFNHLLFRWYEKNRRALPWRKTRNPYRILVSEIMLQQTRVERVLPKYAKFLRRFPTIQTLASVTLGEVLRAWSGLGYNRRAKYLWECARRIQAEHRGVFPEERVMLLALPGVGHSTAAALLSFAFDKDEPMIDTNVRRVLCRVFFNGRVIPDRTLRDFARTLIPHGRGREWNWAVMDAGALYCRARGHLARCPLQKLHGPVDDFTYKKPQTNFKGSHRYWRGKIMASLTTVPNGYTLTKLRNRLELNREDLEIILAALKKERLIKKTGTLLRVP